MILRRKGNSHLVDVEFKDGLLGCACNVGRSREAPPFRREAPPCRHSGGGEITVTTPVVSRDYFSLDLTDNTTEEGSTPTRVLSDSNTTYSRGLMAPRKGPVPHEVRGVFAFLQENQDFETKLILGTNPVDDLASNQAETVPAKESRAQDGKQSSTWDIGIWLELSTKTNEHLAGTRTGVARARTVKRRPEPLKWDRELNLVPWLIDGPVARPEAGWTPTPGCKACDEGRTGMKRRADHSTTTRNVQRDKLFSASDLAKWKLCLLMELLP